MKKNELNGWVKDFKRLCNEDMDREKKMAEDKNELELFQAQAVLEGEIVQYKQWENIFAYIAFGVTIINLIVTIANNVEFRIGSSAFVIIAIFVIVIVVIYAFSLIMSLKIGKCATALSYLKLIQEL